MIPQLPEEHAFFDCSQEPRKWNPDSGHCSVSTGEADAREEVQRVGEPQPTLPIRIAQGDSGVKTQARIRLDPAPLEDHIASGVECHVCGEKEAG